MMRDEESDKASAEHAPLAFGHTLPFYHRRWLSPKGLTLGRAHLQDSVNLPPRFSTCVLDKCRADGRCASGK